MKINFLRHALLSASLLASPFAITSCGVDSTLSKLDTYGSYSQEKIGVLLASHGDIDDAATELEDYIKVSFKKNVGIPLPDWSRDILVGPAYLASVGIIRKQYDIIGATNYRKDSETQAAAVEKALKKSGLNAKVYLGYNFTKPYIEDTMAQIQADGITTLVLFNKGGQFSYASTGENMEDVLSYLKDHPEYDVRVLADRTYSEDPRFQKAMADAIEEDIKTSFPGAAKEDVCVLIGSHGLPMWMIKKGDPAIDQMVEAFEGVGKLLKGYKTYHGYLNDDFIPGAEWIAPAADDLAWQIKKDKCKNVLMDGRLSFTTHHRATLYDLNVEVRGILESAKKNKLGQIDPDFVKPNVVLAPNFDGDPQFAQFIADLTKEILNGEKLAVELKAKGEKALPKGSVGKVGVDPYFH